ncbi:MAG: hypothetical protein JJE35_04865 [Thermoleophilia bacterium]|nr:hypothetical protein [Thermoleophilia bacterium]
MKSFHSRLLLAAAASLAALALAAPIAQAATPAPGYTQFAGCPSTSEVPSVVACVRSVVKGGHFQMGSKNVPISKPMTLTGGTDASLEEFFANSEGGLTPVKQLVPGGIIGLTGLDWLVNFLSIESLQLFAVTELVGKPSIGATISLPIRVHLINPALGKNCYVGSPSSPILLDMTPGTTSPPPPNEPISGMEPVFGYEPAAEIATYSNGTFVDNSFAAPGANGCVLTLFGFIPISINGLINSQSGLPASAGTNETVQNIDIEIAPVNRVYP